MLIVSIFVDRFSWITRSVMSTVLPVLGLVLSAVNPENLKAVFLVSLHFLYYSVAENTYRPSRA